MFEFEGIRSLLQQGLSAARTTGSGASTQLSLQAWVDVVGQCQQVLNTAAALQTIALAHVAALDEVALEDGTVVEEFRGLGHQRLDAPALVDDQLGVSAAAASDRVGSAVDLVTRHPQLLQEMAEGRLDAYRAGVVAAELRDADPQVCRQVDAVVVDRLRATAGAEPAGPLRRRAVRALERLDPDLVRAAAERTRGQRSLRRTAWAPGVDEWSATLPVEQSRSAWSVVDGLARTYLSQGRCAGLETARADALMDLIHARATGHVAVQLTVPASELARHAVDPATLAPDDGKGDALDKAQHEALVPVTGFGMPGITHVRAHWLATLPGAPGAFRQTRRDRGRGPKVPAPARENPGAQHDLAGPAPTTAPVVTVVACDDATGALATLPVGRRVSPVSDSYRPPAWMVAFVRARDGGCRFPGCSVNARSCDLDHVRPWPQGSTEPSNLICLCRRHHRIKQRPGWSVTAHPDGVATWVGPSGRTRTTHPADHLHADHPHADHPHAGHVHTESIPPPERPSTTAACDAQPALPRVPASPPVRQPVPSPVHSPAHAVIASRLEDQVAHDIERRLVAVACRPDTISTRNRRALRHGDRIHADEHAARVPRAGLPAPGGAAQPAASPPDDDPPF